MSSIALGSRLLAGPFSKMTGLNTLQGHHLLPPTVHFFSVHPIFTMFVGRWQVLILSRDTLLTPSVYLFSSHPCNFENVYNVSGEMTGLNTLQGHSLLPPTVHCRKNCSMIGTLTVYIFWPEIQLFTILDRSHL